MLTRIALRAILVSVVVTESSCWASPVPDWNAWGLRVGSDRFVVGHQRLPTEPPHGPIPPPLAGPDRLRRRIAAVLSLQGPLRLRLDTGLPHLGLGGRCPTCRGCCPGMGILRPLNQQAQIRLWACGRCDLLVDGPGQQRNARRDLFVLS